jgi:hypothetical protein
MQTGRGCLLFHSFVRCYEYEKGEFVALADADFKRANVKASETIQIDTFCDVAQIPSMYYEKPYYLSGDRPHGSAQGKSGQIRSEHTKDRAQAEQQAQARLALALAESHKQA